MTKISSTNTNGNGGEIIPPHKGPKCPFYGFFGFKNSFIDNEGNACALTGEHKPCQMEASGNVVNWDNCPENSEENIPELKRIMEEVIIMPEVFWPDGNPTWSGMDFSVWFEYVMGRDTL